MAKTPDVTLVIRSRDKGTPRSAAGTPAGPDAASVFNSDGSDVIANDGASLAKAAVSTEDARAGTCWDKPGGKRMKNMVMRNGLPSEVSCMWLGGLTMSR